MENSMTVMSSSLLNHLTTIKLALELVERLERERPLSSDQQTLVQLAREVTDDVLGEVVRS